MATRSLAPSLLENAKAVMSMLRETLISAGLFLIILSTPLIAQRAQNEVPDQPSLAAIVQRMQRAEANLAGQAPYQVLREYRLFSGNNAMPNSHVLATVNFKPAAGKDYRIEDQSGSRRGEQVVRRILDHEVDASTRPAEAEASALTEANYAFDYISQTVLDRHPCYLLRVKPKRRDKNLIVGEVWVDKTSFLVRHIEGEMVKTPSWWLKQVQLKITFNEMQGIWLQTDVEASADARLVGRQSLNSRAVACQRPPIVAVTAMPMIAPQNSRKKQQMNRVPAEVLFGVTHKLP
jgi:hypothetical protein